MKRVTDNHDVQRAAMAILYYLRDHPLAKDSAKGIARWWVGEERELVEKALALLLQEGMIEKKGQLYQSFTGRVESNKSAAIKRTKHQRQRRKRNR